MAEAGELAEAVESADERDELLSDKPDELVSVREAGCSWAPPRSCCWRLPVVDAGVLVVVVVVVAAAIVAAVVVVVIDAGATVVAPDATGVLGLELDTAESAELATSC